tara:strand:- start:10890 stop:11507 length:618 start_codon:yes stop_codon:yes gene_type:complete
MKIKVFIFLFYWLLADVLVGQESNFKKFRRLSNPEKYWVIFHPFVANKALKITELTRYETVIILNQQLLNGNGNGGQVDAFRHVFWMANLTVEIGWRRATRLGYAHEKGNYRDFKKRRNEDGVVPDKISSVMDLFNNNIGIEIGKMHRRESLKAIVIKKVLDGKCKIIKKDADNNYIDCEGNFISKESLKGKWENKKCLINSNGL